jgi:hypothetical protein
MSRADLARCNCWRHAFADKRKDSRYYELVEDTIREGFEYKYFAIEDEHREVIAIQPFFLLDQDLVAGVNPKIRVLIDSIRRVWPRFLKMRTLMVGCVAGKGTLTETNCRWRPTPSSLPPLSSHTLVISKRV